MAATNDSGPIPDPRRKADWRTVRFALHGQNGVSYQQALMAGQADLCSQPLHQLTLSQKRVGKGQKSLLRVRRAVGGFREVGGTAANDPEPFLAPARPTGQNTKLAGRCSLIITFALRFAPAARSR